MKDYAKQIGVLISKIEAASINQEKTQVQWWYVKLGKKKHKNPIPITDRTRIEGKNASNDEVFANKAI